jgi:predicted phosphodiesterase
MAQILLVADIHATERPPSSCTDSYLEDLLDLLVQTQQIAQGRCVEAVAWAGDVFHHKAPSKTSHRLVMLLIRSILGYPCQVWIVPGNHDITYDRLDSLIRTQPLGVLFERGALRLDGWATVAYEDVVQPRPFYGVPWQQHWTDEAVWEALSAYRGQMGRGWGTQHPLVVTHAPLYPPGQELTYENYPAEKFAAAMGNQGSVFYGHVHEPHGTYIVDGVTFCNNGALSRGSLHEYNLTRQVACTLFDTDTGMFELVPLHAKPASQVFRLAEAQEAKTSQAATEEFLVAIGSTSFAAVSVETVMAHIREQGLGAKEEALVEELLAGEVAGHGK